jgi:hypothetical protein
MRIGAVMLATGAVTGCAALLGPAPAAASSNQWGMFEIPDLATQNPAGQLQVLRSLGVSIVRVYVAWNAIAPNPSSRSRPAFNAADPNSYPASNWAPFDNLINQASARGIAVDLMPTSPAPLWATSTGAPGCGQVGGFPACFENTFMPSASEYGQFVRALATRYRSVHFWELWNEANWGPSLTPQYSGSSFPVSARLYRGLLAAGWTGLQQAGGHSRDTVVASSLSQAGSAHVGQTGTTAPLTFIRTNYCVNPSFRALAGGAARQTGCPTSKKASNRFRGSQPALFKVTGWGIHPYAYSKPPTQLDFPNPNGVAFPQIPNMINTLDRANRAYGSRKAMTVYNTEYAYQNGYVSPENGAKFINWGEYLSYKNPRIGSYDQYELTDSSGFFPTGLVSTNGKLKPSFFAYRMPVWLPSTSVRRGKTLEVWGAARPAPFARRATGKAQFAYIQLNGRTVKAVKITNGRGYFDVRVKFPRSGQVRIAYQYPNTPSMADPLDPSQLVYSRTTGITIR